MHSLHYCNAGQATLTWIRIQYGDVIWPRVASHNYKGDGHDPNCLGGSAITDTMRVPESMQIEWKLADGRTFKVDLPVHSRLLKGYPPSTIQVRFKDDAVEVIERVRPTEATRLDHRLFP